MPTKAKRMLDGEWLVLGDSTVYNYILVSALESGVRVPRVTSAHVWLSREQGVYIEYEGEEVEATMQRLFTYIKSLGSSHFFTPSYLPY